MKFAITVASILLLASCAQSYNSIRPSRLNYHSTSNLDEIKLEYRYDVLRESGNTKFHKKEQRNRLKLVAVKITNNTNEVIIIGKNAAFFSNSKLLVPIEAHTTRNLLKQSQPSYLLYLLLTGFTVSVNYDTYPVGLALGPGLTIGNMITASTANKNLLYELLDYDLNNRQIQPNETVYGLACFSGIGYEPITIKRLN